MGLYSMEPLAHEGLARLLQIDDSLQTPHVISREDLTDSQDLISGGTIKIDKPVDLPPAPLGLDSNKAPYLQLSEEIAVLDNASSLQPPTVSQIRCVALT